MVLAVKRFDGEVSFGALLFFDRGDYVVAQHFLFFVGVGEVIMIFLDSMINLNEQMVIFDETTRDQRFKEAGDGLGFSVQYVLAYNARNVNGIDILAFIVENGYEELSIILVSNGKDFSVAALFNQADFNVLSCEFFFICHFLSSQ